MTPETACPPGCRRICSSAGPITAGHVPPGRHHDARLPAAWPIELALRVCPQQSRVTVEELDPRVGNGGPCAVVDDDQGSRLGFHPGSWTAGVSTVARVGGWLRRRIRGGRRRWSEHPDARGDEQYGHDDAESKAGALGHGVVSPGNSERSGSVHVPVQHVPSSHFPVHSKSPPVFSSSHVIMNFSSQS